MVEWGRASRGRVWHLLDAAAGDTWCRAGDLIVEWTQGLPPIAGRPCPRCRERVAEVAAAIEHASRMADDGWSLLTPRPAAARAEPELETYRGRPVEDVDLVGVLADRQADLHLRDEGPDPQADEEPEWHDPTHGLIDRDLQEQAEAMNPTSVGQLVAIENTLQNQRDRGERP